MLTLSDLPNEIVDLIIRNVTSTKDLLSLSLFSRRLHQLLVSHLYGDIVIRTVDYHDQKAYEKLRKLGITVLSNAYIASCVRRFTFRHEYDTGMIRHFGGLQRTTPRWGQDATACGVLAAEYRAAIDASSLTTAEASMWAEDLQPRRRNNLDALLALILPIFSHLDRLDLTIPTHSKYLERMMHRAVCHEKPFDSQVSFRYVKHVEISYCNVGNGGQYLAPYFNLPAIRRIQASKLTRAFAEEACVPLLVPGSSTVTFLEFQNCYFSVPELAHLVRACRSLKTFIYKRPVQSARFTRVTSSELLSALASAELSLENIWLDYADEEHSLDKASLYHKHGEGEQLTPTSFVEFRNLKRLNVNASVVLGGHTECEDPSEADDTRPTVAELQLVEQLPRSLECLHLTTPRRGAVRALIFHLEELLLQRLMERMPLLGEISIEAPQGRRWTEYDCTRLDSLAEAANVRIRKLNLWEPRQQWAD